MNNANPFVPQGSFLEQKNKARVRLRLAVFFSISLSVFALMALLIQGCRKNDTTGDEANNTANTNQEALPTNPTPESNAAAVTPPESNPVPVTPPPAALPPQLPPPALATSDYTVVKGDTFAGIAAKNNVTVKQIEEANPGVDPKRLKIGQKIHLPAPGSAPATAQPNTPAAAESAPAGEETYKVKSGDTLISIAKQFHTTVKAIESANNLTSTQIRVGKTLKIPVRPAPAAAPSNPSAEAPPAELPAATPTNH